MLVLTQELKDLQKSKKVCDSKKNALAARLLEQEQGW